MPPISQSRADPIPAIALFRVAIVNAMLVIVTYFAGVLPAQADITVSKRDCDRLVKYQQAPGV